MPTETHTQQLTTEKSSCIRPAVEAKRDITNELTKENYMCNVLLAGGNKISKQALASLGMNVHTQWVKQPEGGEIPLDVDQVVLVSDDVDRFLTQYVRSLCEKELIPLVYTKSDLTNFEDALNRAVEVVTKLEEESMGDSTSAWDNLEAHMAAHDGRTDGKNVQRAQEKITFLKELLAKDPKTPTESVQEEIVKKFGKGLTPTTIANVRWNEFGLKFGPRGKLITKRASPAKEAVATMTAAPSQSPQTDKLSSILSDLRKAMVEANVSLLTIPLDGEVHAVQHVPQEIHFQVH